MSFWQNVVSELEYRNIDRKKLADEAGFNVSNISNGIRQNNIPSADTAYRIAKFLGVSVEYLVTGSLDSNKEPNELLAEEILKFQKFRGHIDILSSLDNSMQKIVINLTKSLAEI